MPLLVFFGALLGAQALHLLIRARVNQQLPPLQRVRLFETDYLHVMRLHKQFYPDSPLRMWFWVLMTVALASSMLSFLQAIAHRH